MELVVIILNRTEYLTEILDGFVAEGIKGATVIDSAGMGHLVADHIPFFSHFAEINSSTSTHSKTIFTVVDGPHERQTAVTIVERAVGQISQPDTAFIFSVPVVFMKGLTSKGCDPLP